jgi:iron complex outermembrane receptor protein
MKTFGKIALAGVSLWALAAPGMAAAAEAEEGVSNAGIIVMARRKGEDVQDVPQVVQALGGQELKELEIREFEDLTSVVPGLNLDTNNSAFSGAATMRGLDFISNASGAATSVEFYRNDAPTSPGPIFQALYDVGQIEVQRGPQGTLRGRSSPSGAITITTKKPVMDEIGGYAVGTVAEDGKWQGEAAVNVPIIRDKLGIRVAGFANKSRGSGVFGINPGTGTIDKDVWKKTESLRASVRADPFDGVLILDFNYETTRTRSRQYGSGEFRQAESFANVNSNAGSSPFVILPSDDLVPADFAGTVKQTYKFYNWQAQLNLIGQSLTYVGANTKNGVNSFAPDDVGGFFGNATAGGVPFGQTSIANPMQNTDRIANIFDYVVGYLIVDDASPTTLFRATGFGNFGDPDLLYSDAVLNLVALSGTHRFRIAKERSWFGNLTLHVTERLEFSGGVRRIRSGQDSGVGVGAATLDLSGFNDITSLHRCYGYGGVVTLDVNSTYDYSTCDPYRKATIYNLSGKYDITDNIMAYVTYGTSWRPGNSIIGYRGSPGTFLSQFLELANEKSKAIEGGFKSTWFDNKMRLNVSVYRQTFKGYPYRLGTPVISTAAPGSETLASAFQFVVPTNPKITGFEAELAWDPLDNLTIAANLAYANGKISGASLPCVDLDNDNIPDQGAAPSGAQLNAEVGNNQVDLCSTKLTASTAPKWSGTFLGEYSHDLGSNFEGFIRTLVTWRGSGKGDLLNQFDDAKSYALVNLFLGVRDPDGDWDVTLYGRNLFNTRRVTSRTGVAQTTNLRDAGASNGTQYVVINVTDPRELGVTLRVSFGSR